MRLQKYIAISGICSRRKAEEYILEGKVKLNGEVVNEMGKKVDIQRDIVSINDEEIKYEDNKKYIILHKPIRIYYYSKRPIQ